MKPQPTHAVIISRNLTSQPLTKPLITVEATGKWYRLWVVKPGVKYEALSFLELDEVGSADEYRMGSAYVDHVPNPRYVVRYAKLHDYDVDEVALEVMVGRWELEGPSEPRDFYAEMWLSACEKPSST